MEAFKLLKCIYQINSPTYEKNVGLFMDLFDMKNFIQNPVRSLSLGQRMKCEIAAAFLHNPPMVFLDEPTIGLDVFSKDAIGTFLQEMKKKGITLVLTTHDLEEIRKICDRAVVLHQGEILLEEGIQKLISMENRERELVFTLKNKNPVPLGLPSPMKAVYGDYTLTVKQVQNGDTGFVISQVVKENQVADISFSNLNFTQIIKKHLEG